MMCFAIRVDRVPQGDDIPQGDGIRAGKVFKKASGVDAPIMKQGVTVRVTVLVYRGE